MCMLVMLPALFLVSCREDVEIPGNNNQLQKESTVVLSLSMPGANGTRAEGDDEVHPDVAALERENKVDNLTVFIFTDKSGAPSDKRGINGDPDTKINFSEYYTSEMFTTDKNGNITLEFTVPKDIVGSGDRFVVFANMGNCSNMKTLGDLQIYKPTVSFQKGSYAKDCTSFAMSNAYKNDGVIYQTVGTNSETRYYGEVSIERIAARIDLDFTPGTNSSFYQIEEDGSLWYEVSGDFTDENGIVHKNADLGRVYLTHVIPINVMQKSSFALKRISEDTEGYFFWQRYTFGGVLPVSGGVAQRYVIEPQTGDKPGSDIFYDSWYGNTKASLATDTTKFYSQDKHLKNVFNGREKLDIDNAVILGYANENTQHTNYNDASCLTGLVIQAQFIPRKLYMSYDAINDKLGDDFKLEKDIVRNTDIYRYTPQITTTTEGDVIYFANEKDAEAYQLNHPEDLSQIKKFPLGYCYYYLWLRHYPGAGETEGKPMAFGIVRNHVYRVSLSFKGIGREGLVVESPDNVEAKILVRPWYVREYPEIIM